MAAFPEATSYDEFEQLITSATTLVSKTTNTGTQESLIASYGRTPISYSLNCGKCHRNMGLSALILTHSVKTSDGEEHCSASFHMECMVAGSLEECSDDIDCPKCGLQFPQPEHVSLSELIYIADGYEIHATGCLTLARRGLRTIASRLGTFIVDRKESALEFGLNHHYMFDGNVYTGIGKVCRLVSASEFLMNALMDQYLEAVYMDIQAQVTRIYDGVIADFCEGKIDYGDACETMCNMLCPFENSEVEVSVEASVRAVVRQTISMSSMHAMDLVPDDVIRVFQMLMEDGLGREDTD